VHSFTAGQGNEGDIGVASNAFGVHRDHRLIDESSQVGIEGGHALTLLGFGCHMHNVNLRMGGEEPNRLGSTIAGGTNDACFDVLHDDLPASPNSYMLNLACVAGASRRC
jgi:hypothetical protein